ncbi:MAG: hypothetical protein AAGM67_00045 [Bacteroidota bacterium]
MLCLLLTVGKLIADNPISPFELESLINQQILSFPFSQDNHFRIAAYAEMKGEYSAQFQSMTMHFGSLGVLSVYPQNCLLRSPRGVFHLDKLRSTPDQIEAINRELGLLFDQIILLGNHSAKPELVDFVDRHLARKNIEPFDKIFLRHILVKYGRFESNFKRVVFHSDWLPDTAYTYRAPGEKRVVRRPINPLMVKLDENIVRGYYIRAGGTVYVEDVEREVFYATGEEYLYNVSAFKLFVQKLFVQTTHYIVKTERARLDLFEKERSKPTIREIIKKQEPQLAYSPDPTAVYLPNTERDRVKKLVKVDLREVDPLYHHENWIPMMLGLLRSRRINIGDPDIIKYFVGKPYFDKVYDQLTPEEKQRVDAYLRRQNSEIRK